MDVNREFRPCRATIVPGQVSIEGNEKKLKIGSQAGEVAKYWARIGLESAKLALLRWRSMFTKIAFPGGA